MSPLVKATGIGTLLQTAMVVVGHLVPRLPRQGSFRSAAR